MTSTTDNSSPDLEHVSALVDDALDATACARTADKLCADQAAADAWARYHLIGDAMRGAPAVSADFSSRVMAALDGVSQDAPEAGAAKVVSLDAQRSKRAIRAPAASRRRTGFAVAASVAAAALIGVWTLGGTGGDGTTDDYLVARDSGPVAAERPAASLQTVANQRQPVRYSQVDPDAARQLSGYLMDHSRSRSGTNVQGALGYARVATYQPAQASQPQAADSLEAVQD